MATVSSPQVAISTCSDELQRPDFIAISEFSELEGPLPLAIVTGTRYLDLQQGEQVDDKHTSPIDSELKALGLQDFDLNAFAVRVVSVDQAVDVEHLDLPYQDDWDADKTFSIPDDTQVYTTDMDQQCYAFTHHLTLFDINARGYVHPVALSYITSDPEKILSRFDTFIERFKEVARRMKKGNFSNFCLDLKCRLLDLEYTGSVLNSGKETEKKSPVSIEALQQAITVTKLMIDAIESHVSQLSHEPSRESDHDVPRNPDEFASVGPTTTIGETVKKDQMTAPQEPVSSSLQSSALFAHMHNESTGSISIIKPAEDYKPKFVETLHPVPNFERKLRTLAQLCQEPAFLRAKRPETTVIPLVSVIEPKSLNENDASDARKSTLSSAIVHDMYSEAITAMMELTRDLGRDNETLDFIDEETNYLEPHSGVVSVGQTFVINMKNPPPHHQKHYQPDRIPEEPGETESRNPLASIELASGRLWQDDEEEKYVKIIVELREVLPHIIFTLLTGRPVVVLGVTENRCLVQDIIRTLSVFVPCHVQKLAKIKAWSDAKLTDKELADVRLVGASKDNVDSSIFKLDMACMDVTVERKASLITSPLYLDGRWIHEIIKYMDSAPANHAFLSFLNTLCTEIALKAYIYHHLFVLGGHAIGRDLCNIRNSGKDSTQEHRKNSLAKKWSVRKIMSYLRRIEERENDEDARQRDPKAKSLQTGSSDDEEGDEEGDDDEDDFYDDEDDENDRAPDNNRLQEQSSRVSAADMLSLTERRGRRFLAETLDVHGDDQSIVVYFASIVCTQ